MTDKPNKKRPYSKEALERIERALRRPLHKAWYKRIPATT